MEKKDQMKLEMPVCYLKRAAGTQKTEVNLSWFNIAQNKLTIF